MQHLQHLQQSQHLQQLQQDIQTAQQRALQERAHCEHCNRVDTLVAKNNSPRIIARSFNDLNSQMAMSLGGFRVVESFWGKHLEFEVILSSGGKTYRAWKSHAEFEYLFEKLVRKLGQTSMVRCSDRWARLDNSIRWWTVKDVKYMVYRFCLLTDFLQELFFAMDDLTDLVDWASKGSGKKEVCSGCTRKEVVGLPANPGAFVFAVEGRDPYIP